MRFEPDGQAVHLPGGTLRIVHHREQPLAETLLAHKLLQAARPIGRSGAEDVAFVAVVINEGIRSWRRKKRRRRRRAAMVVEHGKIVSMTQVAEQIAELFMGDGVRHHHAADFDRFGRNAENQRGPRLGGRAVGDDGRNGKPAHDQVAILVAGTEWQLAGNAQKAILGTHLVFGFNAHVINLVRRCVGKDHRFRPAATAGCHCARNGRRVQIGQRGIR